MSVRIRQCSFSDAVRLVEIYAPYVQDTAVSFEYAVPSTEVFKERIKNIVARYPFLVAEVDGDVVGYCYASDFKQRCAYSHCVETSIYIAKDFQGKGIGKMLYNELERQLADRGIKNIYACIAWTDIPNERLSHKSVEFHKRIGFSHVAHFHRCGWKFDEWYDTVCMEKLINHYGLF